MYFLYVDESGIEDLTGGTNHFILIGLAIPAEKWKSLDLNLLQIKQKYQLENQEIHTAWMARRYVEQSNLADFGKLSWNERRMEVERNIRKRAGQIGIQGNQKKIKNYRKEVSKIRPYIHLTFDERKKCLIDLAAELGRWGYLRLFAEAISKPHFTIQGNQPYEIAFEQVLTRFQAFLAAFDEKGIVIQDNNSTVAPRLNQLMRKFHRSGTFFRMIDNIIETPFFVDSCLTSMIQMADLCAYALRRYIEKDEKYLWELVENRIDRKDGIAVGIRHFTGKRPCQCSICQSHGRYL
ncbi:MAG: DUF3800 domain-containing protein [Myxococcales bacterium]|nr:DUF3800 domain-containing protein [Myxococcales bacterium]